MKKKKTRWSGDRGLAGGEEKSSGSREEKEGEEEKERGEKEGEEEKERGEKRRKKNGTVLKMSQSPINEQATSTLVGQAEQSSPAPATVEQTTPAVHNANGTENGNMVT
ncbi:hypothetical protein LINPERHAP2_LOCUS38248 [Linum perenne]